MIKTLKYIIVGCVVGIAVGVLSITANKLYKSLLFKYVSKSAFRVHGYSQNVRAVFTSGTGFYTKGKSGNVYFITARHICDELAPNHMMVVSNQNKLMPIKNISKFNVIDVAEVRKISENNDICILKGRQDMPTLSLNTNPLTADQELYAVGGTDFYTISLIPTNPLHLLTSVEHAFVTKNPENCVHKNQKVQYMIGEKIVDTLPNTIRKVVSTNGTFVPVGVKHLCVNTADIILLNVKLYDGYSGGPVVDSFGRVVGIIMKTINSQGVSSVVPASEIVKELEDL